MPKLRRRPPVAKEERLGATPETAAKLRPAPWYAWPEPHRYASAATEIALAFGLICSGLFAKAFDLTRITGRITNDSDGQSAAIDRYRAWVKKLPPLGLGPILDAVVDHRVDVDPAVIRTGLDLYLQMFPAPLDNRRDSG